MQSHGDTDGISDSRDQGFTLVEILIAIVIIGILATVTVFAVRGITDRGQEASCAADARTITQAADVYMGQNNVDAVPATGLPADVERFERTLVDAGLLKSVSSLYALAGDGTISVQNTACN
jgi:prepilin-type N-terminal cleavage/methylation domain-containing protein